MPQRGKVPFSRSTAKPPATVRSACGVKVQGVKCAEREKCGVYVRTREGTGASGMRERRLI